MGSSLSYDDGVIDLTVQTGPNSYTNQKIAISELESFSYRRPGAFVNGSLRFQLRDGTSTESLKVSKIHKKIFDVLVTTIQADLDNASSFGDKRNLGRSRTFRTEEKGLSMSSQGSLQSAMGNWETWVAVDIEWTDSSDKSSICEIGLAKFQNGKPVESWRSYVRPPGRFKMGLYERQTHGIDEEVLLSAPTLADLWDDIENFIGGNAWVLHNATSDINRILKTLAVEGHRGPRDFRYLDTMLLARKSSFVTSSSGLDDLANFYDLERVFADYDNRHDAGDAHGALEDARLTGKVLCKMMASVSYTSIPAFLELLGASVGLVRDGEVVSGFSAPGQFSYENLQDIPTENELTQRLEKKISASDKAQENRRLAEEAKLAFLSTDPIPWSDHVITADDRVYFSSFSQDGFHDKIEQELRRLGATMNTFSASVTLLIIADHAVEDSAKLRNCFSFRSQVPVTNYSNFLRNNRQFPLYKPDAKEKW